jgi:tryptophan synthase alpha chain
MALSSTTRSRIARRFDALRATGELGIVAYITAGDPTLEATRHFVPALAEAGADIIELGVPFSDPVADGPTIQRASERALASGTTLEKILALVPNLRNATQVPIILFSYYNPVFQMGLDRFAGVAADAGADGVLITDLTPEEAADYRRAVSARALDTIFLAAPTSTNERLVRIAACSSGFLYVVSRTGVTGAKNSLPEELPALLRRVRVATKLPIAVGFGISLPGQISVLGGLADAAVVGSALVSDIEQTTSADGASGAAIDAACVALAERMSALKRAARSGMSRREAVL